MSVPDPKFQSVDQMIVRIGVGITLVAFTTAVVRHFVQGDAPMMAQVFHSDAFAIG